MSGALSLLRSKFNSVDNFVAELLIRYPNFEDVDGKVLAAEFGLSFAQWSGVVSSAEFNDAVDRVLALESYSPSRRRDHVRFLAGVAAGDLQRSVSRGVEVLVAPKPRDVIFADEHLRALQNREVGGGRSVGGINFIYHSHNYSGGDDGGGEERVVDAQPFISEEDEVFGSYEQSEPGGLPPVGSRHVYSSAGRTFGVEDELPGNAGVPFEVSPGRFGGVGAGESGELSGDEMRELVSEASERFNSFFSGEVKGDD